jgi:hypothetical protein
MVNNSEIALKSSSIYVKLIDIYSIGEILTKMFK